MYPDQKLNIFLTPQIDSRDFYPLELLLKANYVIVSTPVQYHLSNPEGQKVVEVVHRALTENWGIAEDFVRLSEEFELSDHVVLNIYKRQKRSSLETVISTFSTMTQFIGRRPGSQPDWIDLSPGLDMPLSKIGESTWKRKIILQPTIPDGRYQMLFADLVPLSGKVTGAWEILNEASCSFNLGIETLDPSGNAQETHETYSAITDRSSFSFAFESQIPVYLVFYVTPNPENTNIYPCSIELEWALVE